MCGSPLEPAAPERRKLATMLFCDMSGSTAMGERVDAESVREMMFSYFHEMRAAIERHGGTVEKFIGDAVMAVFGVPTAHEDDALRAVRAAWEMQERLVALNEQLEQRYGSTIALRIGVNTGEVVAGEGTTRQALVTGDAVNVAARLEQTAAPGQVLIGEPTLRLVRDAVSVEAVEPLALKGKSEPVPAYRVLAIDAAAPALSRRLDTPMVGREAELTQLESMLDETKRGRCLLATVVGEPGVGKSRLAAELIAGAHDVQVLRGSCLQYGEGITYWPIAEIVRQAAGIRDEHSREEAAGADRGARPGWRGGDGRAGDRPGRGPVGTGRDRVGDRRALRRQSRGDAHCSCSSTTSTGPSPHCSSSSQASRHAPRTFRCSSSVSRDPSSSRATRRGTRRCGSSRWSRATRRRSSSSSSARRSSRRGSRSACRAPPRATRSSSRSSSAC